MSLSSETLFFSAFPRKLLGNNICSNRTHLCGFSYLGVLVGGAFYGCWSLINWKILCVVICENKDTLLQDVLFKRRVPRRNFSFLVDSGCTSYALQLLKYSTTHLKGERSTDDKNWYVYAVTSLSCGLGLQNDLCIHQLTSSLMTLVKEPVINSASDSCRGAHYGCTVAWI